MGEKSPKRVVIGFGRTFIRAGHPDDIRVITDVGDGSAFYAGQVTTNKAGERVIPPLSHGTAYIRDIGKMGRTLSEEEVIAASERGCREAGYEMVPRQRSLLRELASQKSRKITLIRPKRR